jgi:hypothetical protein
LLYQLSYAGNFFYVVPAIHGSTKSHFPKPAMPSWHGVRRAEAMLRLCQLTQLSYAGFIFGGGIILVCAVSGKGQ